LHDRSNELEAVTVVFSDESVYFIPVASAAWVPEALYVLVVGTDFVPRVIFTNPILCFIGTESEVEDAAIPPICKSRDLNVFTLLWSVADTGHPLAIFPRNNSELRCREGFNLMGNKRVTNDGGCIFLSEGFNPTLLSCFATSE